jgi:thioredoxin 1
MPLPILDITSPAELDRLTAEAGDDLIIIDFYGPDCPNCEVFAADAPSLLEDLDGLPIRILKIDAYQHTALARRFALFGVPTFILLRRGKVLGKMSQYHGRSFWLTVIREQLAASQVTSRA